MPFYNMVWVFWVGFFFLVGREGSQSFLNLLCSVILSWWRKKVYSGFIY